jgi:NAD-dependent DNA ligase
MPRDKALKTAKGILHRTVCECGCLSTEHEASEDQRCLGESCPCLRFKAVRFFIERRAKIAVVRYKDESVYL